MARNLDDEIQRYLRMVGGIQYKDEMTFLNPLNKKRISPRQNFRHSFGTIAHQAEDTDTSLYPDAGLEFLITYSW